MPMEMSEDALNAATVRLERAIGRLERVVAARASAGNGVAEAYAMLEERHETLRARVQETIDQLDQLIGREAGR
jgi:tetrahydromethanopterin S-methyltransferase subunit G